ncbi:MAG: siderophore-interacting protein [Myxococcota bacterium]
MSRADYRELTVVSMRAWTPNMVEVVVGGDELSGFPTDAESGYVKLLLPREGADDTPFDLRRAVKRSYTVRAFDPAKNELTLLFAKHDPCGPATRWMKGAQVGDLVRITGPGYVKGLEPTADWFLLAGDLTALPAIAVLLERLPADANGHVLLEVPGDADAVALRRPAGMEIHWLASRDNGRSPLPDAVQALDWPAGRVGVWVACEYTAMKSLREYLVSVRGVTRQQMYISSYWKRGNSDEEHKVFKKAEAARVEALEAATSALR